MANIKWSRTRKFRGYEEKYEPGTELSNGRIVVARRLDSLAARAAEAEKKWLEERAEKAKKQRQRRREARRRPSKAQEQRIKQIRVQLCCTED